MARVVFTTCGSYGDIHPYLAVGLGLKRRGHQVTIATAEFYRRNVEAEGLRFHPVRPDFAPKRAPAEVIRRSFDPYTGANYLLKTLWLPYVEQSYEDLLEACRQADLLVIHPTMFAAPLVAEKLQLKWISVVLAPSVFLSAIDPPVYPPFPWLHALRHLGPLPHRLLVRGIKALTRNWMRPIERLREREGLPVSGRCAMHDDMFSPFGTLAWFSRLLAAPQTDWPEGTQITGFPMYHARETGEGMDPRLREFLDGGDPPIVFTLGSCAVVDAGSFYKDSVEAARLTGRRAVFLTGERTLPITPNESLFFTAYAPYSELFPRAASVVHQGGIGTIGQALRAGVPMLITPLGLDQPDNAARAARLGVARVLARPRYTARGAAKHLDVLLNQPEYAKNARFVAAQLAREDGVETACDALERVCAPSWDAIEEKVAIGG